MTVTSIKNHMTRKTVDLPIGVDREGDLVTVNVSKRHCYNWCFGGDYKRASELATIWQQWVEAKASDYATGILTTTKEEVEEVNSERVRRIELFEKYGKADFEDYQSSQETRDPNLKELFVFCEDTALLRSHQRVRIGGTGIHLIVFGVCTNLPTTMRVFLGGRVYFHSHYLKSTAAQLILGTVENDITEGLEDGDLLVDRGNGTRSKLSALTLE